ncbi:MAG: dihydrofolate reductase [Candidatus Amulumruptor caecigallinarius]|nr:dihydrofolate reductase [Candidatus Amulumruptor caecigallinarius]
MEKESCRQLWAVVAMGRNREIGINGDMPWHLPEDLKHFKELTLGHPVIMGRATWESLPKHPLPGRRNMVLTHKANYEARGAECFPSLEDALESCAPGEVPVIMGGGRIYAMALPKCTRLYVTQIEAEYPDAETWFPEISPNEWALTEQSEIMESRCGMHYQFLIYERRNG